MKKSLTQERTELPELLKIDFCLWATLANYILEKERILDCANTSKRYIQSTLISKTLAVRNHSKIALYCF